MKCFKIVHLYLLSPVLRNRKKNKQEKCMKIPNGIQLNKNSANRNKHLKSLKGGGGQYGLRNFPRLIAFNLYGKNQLPLNGTLTKIWTIAYHLLATPFCHVRHFPQTTVSQHP